MLRFIYFCFCFPKRKREGTSIGNTHIQTQINPQAAHVANGREQHITTPPFKYPQLAVRKRKRETKKEKQWGRDPLK